MAYMSTVPVLSLPGLKSIIGRRDLSPFTRIGMTFYPHQGDPVFPHRQTSAISVTWDKKKTQAALQSFGFQKLLGQASGRWTALIKDNHPYQLDVAEGDILPGDWIDLFALRNGIEIPICRGVVDIVNRRRFGAGGATVQEWHLEGRDHGTPWESPISYSNIYIRLPSELAVGIMTDRVKGVIGGSPGRMFKLLTDACFNYQVAVNNWVMPECMPFQGVWVDQTGVAPSPGVYSPSFIERFEMAIGPTRGGYYNAPLLWHQAGQTVHQMITDWCNPQLNEIVYDLALDANYQNTGIPQARMVATIRERPFLLVDDDLYFTDSEIGQSVWVGQESPWFGLPTWRIPTWAFSNISTGRNGLERFNVFQLMAEVGYETKSEEVATALPLWYGDSVGNYGLKAMIETTKYVCGEKTKAGAGWVQERVNWQRMLLNWYCLNPWFLGGSVSSPIMLPEVRIGQRLVVHNGNRKEDETYYVEGQNLGYSRSGIGPPSVQSSFNVTRGWRGTDSDLINATKTISGKYKESHL